MKNKDIIKFVINKVEKCYNHEQNKLHKISVKAKTEGEIRAAAGNLIENILQCIFDSLNSKLPLTNIISKIGTNDFLSKKITYKGKEILFNTIQYR